MEYYTITCANCGIDFGISSSYKEVKILNGGLFWCPNGHQLSWNKRTAAMNELIDKILDALEKWLEAFDKGDLKHDGPTVDDLKKLMIEFKQYRSKK